MAISLIGMFSARPEWSQTQLFAWLAITNILFWVGSTMVDVPHAAFGSEMTSTHGERISILFLMFPITRARHEKTLAELERRRARRESGRQFVATVSRGQGCFLRRAEGPE